MLEIRTTKEQRDTAMKLAAPLIEQYANNKNSIRKGQGHYIGKLAELVVVDTLKLRHIDTYNSDTEATLLNGTNLKIEVKAKERNVPPRGFYNSTVACYNTKQICDYYLFCSSLRDEIIYIIGIMQKDEFLKKAIFYKKGDLDPDRPSGTNWRFKADCYNMQYKLMRRVGRTILPD